MVSIVDSHYPGMLERQSEDCNPYPEPPQGIFTSPPLDLSLPASAYTTANNTTTYPSGAQDTFPTSLAYNSGSLYVEAPNYAYGERSSPSHFTEDSEMRAPSSNLSTTSAPSAASSAVGSPQSNHGQLAPIPEWGAQGQGLGVQPSIVGQNDFYNTGGEYTTFSGMDAEYPIYDFNNTKPGFVDPSLIHPEINNRALNVPYEGNFQTPNAANTYPASPSLSPQPQQGMRAGSHSPFTHKYQYSSPYQAPMDPNAMDPNGSRRPSAAPFVSPSFSEANMYSGDEKQEKQRCPHPDCGKTFKDLRAHMLTHQTERPEKCPIQNCEYHTKGFARKYDKNRHTLTHYKGTMVCGFCPGSGSAAEKSFNRADVFKRHLTSVHGVEQTPPNSRKKSTGLTTTKKLAGYPPDATGKCSTCSQTFSNAQDFYEHLDDCVLRIVQQEDPAEAVNAKLLGELENDAEVNQTLEKNHLPTTTPTPGHDNGEEDEEDEEMEDDDSPRDSKGGMSPLKRKTNPPNGVQKSRGMTYSRGGVPLHAKTRGRKNRRDYPSSWGFDKGQMTMKKRVMAVFDGGRRLAKDDMMLSTEHEVRVKLLDGKSYVTDLDVQTMKRAEGFLNATDEEKGPWISDDPTEEQLHQMREMLEGKAA